MAIFKKTTLILSILVFIFVLFSTSVQSAKATGLYFLPSSGSYTIGQTFTVSVYVSSPDQAINAVSGVISFPQDKLQIISLSKTGSVMSLWVQEPSFSNISGTINFEGIVLNPGFIGNSGKIIDIIFKTKASGITPLSFVSASVLANDGNGTNILASLGSANYSVITTTTTATSPRTPMPRTPIIDARAPKAVVISSETHPDPNKWYSSATAKFSWTLTDDITATRLLISKNPNAVPTILYTPPIVSKTVTNLDEGILYFYVQLQNKYGWGDIARFRLQIDYTPPGPLEIRIDNEGNPANSQPIFWFKTNDSFSGLDFYSIEIGDIYNLKVSPEEVKQGFYRIPPCPPGIYPVTIKAIDKVGRYSSATTELIIKSPVIINGLCQSCIENPLKDTKIAYIGSFIIKHSKVFFILSIIVFFALIVVLGIMFLLYHWRSKLLKEEYKKETKETEKILYRAFDSLRKEVTKQVAKLDGNDLLSEREIEVNEELKKATRDSEQLINEKLKDIKEKMDKT